jgi:hypothetical protein
LLPPKPPPADVIDEKTEFEPLYHLLGGATSPPPPTVIGKQVAVAVNAPVACC